MASFSKQENTQFGVARLKIQKFMSPKFMIMPAIKNSKKYVFLISNIKVQIMTKKQVKQYEKINEHKLSGKRKNKIIK